MDKLFCCESTIEYNGALINDIRLKMNEVKQEPYMGELNRTRLVDNRDIMYKNGSGESGD